MVLYSNLNRSVSTDTSKLDKSNAAGITHKLQMWGLYDMGKISVTNKRDAN